MMLTLLAPLFPPLIHPSRHGGGWSGHAVAGLGSLAADGDCCVVARLGNLANVYGRGLDGRP